MAEKQTNKERLKDITDGIEAGIKELFQSERYAKYLRTMSRFHRYSVNNTLLIHMQKPDATQVAGFNKWKKEFSRNVKKGEKGIKIIAPTPFKKKIEEEKLDPDTKLPMLDEDGNIIMEEKEIKIPMYKPVVVFDVSQTEGEPLPTLASDLKGNVRHYEVFMEALRRSSPVPVEFEPLKPGMDGYFSTKDQRIAIRDGMSEVQTICAAVHEITHAKLHNYEKQRQADAVSDDTPAPAVPKDRNTEEVEAESVSFAVCSYYGIETGENSFGYIASWSSGKELKELRASLETISRTADELICDIDRHFREICKEREISLDVEETQPEPELTAELPPLPDTRLDEYPMPDNSCNPSDLEQYGIFDHSLLPISKEAAADMIDRDLTVYADTNEGTVMVFDRSEVEAYKDGTLFAALREEWEHSDEFKAAVTGRMDRQQEREADFLEHSGDSFAIYQLRDGDETRDLRYMPMPEQGVDKRFYELAYTGNLPEQDAVDGTTAALDKLFDRFNTNQPPDYMRPSMSVSDIVAIRQEGVLSCHYVDRFAFNELHGFFTEDNPLKNAEMQMEDDYNMLDGTINNGPKQPTVAELEEQVKGGQSISLMDLAEAVHREKGREKPDRAEKRPSVLEKLRRPLLTEQSVKTAPEKSAERGLD